MNKSEVEVLYVPFITQSQTINWISRCVDVFNDKGISAKLLDLYKINWEGIFPHFFEDKNENILKYTKYIAFIRFSFIYRANVKLNLFFYFLKNFLSQKRIVLISSVFDQNFIQIIHFVRPSLVIGDACDYFQLNLIKSMYDYCDVILTNSAPIQSIHQKKHKKTKLISAGYFLEKELIQQSQHTSFKPKTVIFIGTIDWRLDMKFIVKVMKKLRDHTFIFYSIEVDYFSKNNSSTINQKNKVAQKLWGEVSKQPNFLQVKIKSQEELSKIHIEASVGIIAYTGSSLFNRYCHPIKFYNYLAMGLPVVSKPIKSISRYQSDYISFEGDLNAFCKKISTYSSMELDKKVKKDHFTFAKSQSIEKKVEQIKEIIDSEKIISQPKRNFFNFMTNK
jgi:hypothetical protein